STSPPSAFSASCSTTSAFEEAGRQRGRLRSQRPGERWSDRRVRARDRHEREPDGASVCGRGGRRVRTCASGARPRPARRARRVGAPERDLGCIARDGGGRRLVRGSSPARPLPRARRPRADTPRLAPARAPPRPGAVRLPPARARALLPPGQGRDPDVQLRRRARARAARPLRPGRPRRGRRGWDRPRDVRMKALLAGWFSFEQMGASAGDLLARDVVRDWLDGAGVAYDVALAPPFAGGVDWRSVDADDYTHVVFVCGPVGNGEPLVGLLERFRGRRLVGVDVTMLDDLERWNPFDVLLERDSSRTTRPDLAFLAPPRRVPVVGVVLIDAQPEYGDGDLHEPADAAIERVLAAREVVTIRVDTRLDTNDQTAAEVESLIARTDAVLTTRLHGLVLALKNGVP